MKIRNIELSGEIKKSNIRSRGRFRFCLICLFLGFSLILLKITHLSILYNKNANPSVVHSHQAKNIIDHKRADIVDRNGELLATSLLSYDLSANPKLIKNIDFFWQNIYCARSIANNFAINNKVRINLWFYR